MVLNQYGVNIDQSVLGTEMGTTQSSGTSRSAMGVNLNNHQAQNTYVWQNLTYDPPNFPNGTSDLTYYTQWDIYYGFPPVYNVLTYSAPGTPGEGGHGGPLWHWGNTRVWHYFPSSGYDVAAGQTRVNDPWWPSRDWYYFSNMMLAIDNMPYSDQILW
jgi:hypothetical protein